MTLLLHTQMEKIKIIDDTYKLWIIRENYKMINKITLDNIASFKKSVSLETDKKINLIYGLNGTGKSGKK